jgi:hypothetical protein
MAILIFAFYLIGQAFSILKRAHLAHEDTLKYLKDNWIDQGWQFTVSTALFFVIWREPAWVAGLLTKFIPLDPAATLAAVELLKANIFTAVIFGYFNQSITDWAFATVKKKFQQQQ